MCKSVRCCKFPWAIFHAVDVMAQSERHVEDVERIKRRNTWVVSTIGSVLRRWALTFHLLGVCAQISVQSRISFYVSSFVWCEFILRQNWCTGNFKSMRQVGVLSQAIFLQLVISSFVDQWSRGWESCSCSYSPWRVRVLLRFPLV